MKTIPHIVIGMLLSLLLAGGMWLAACAPQGESVALRPPPTPASIQVSVGGAVEHPGVYTLEVNSRVADAVEAAGGFVAEADKDALNLAARVENAQKLDVPYAGEFVPDEEQDFVIAIVDTPSPLVGSEPLGIRSATLTEMDKLPDVDTTIAVSDTSTPSCSDGLVGSGAFVWPSENHFLSGKGYESDHLGIDIAAGEGSPVYAADSGVITAMGNDESGYGNVIQINHGNGYFTVYAHLSVIGVSMCQSVYGGQRIGAAGNTGNSRGVHLHFEVVRNGWSINPWLVLP